MSLTHARAHTPFRVEHVTRNVSYWTGVVVWMGWLAWQPERTLLRTWWMNWRHVCFVKSATFIQSTSRALCAHTTNQHEFLMHVNNQWKDPWQAVSPMGDCAWLVSWNSGGDAPVEREQMSAHVDRGVSVRSSCDIAGLSVTPHSSLPSWGW